MWIEVNLHACVKCGFYWADFHGIRNERVNSCEQLLRVLDRSYKKGVKYGFFSVNYDYRLADCHKPTFTGQFFVNDSYTALQENWKACW
jgi:hypothetical protein